MRSTTAPEHGPAHPGETAYVYSGKGTSQRTRNNDLLLYAGLPRSFWKDDSHVAYLRHPDGKIIDTMHAGRAPRHPDGHSPQAAPARQNP